jgi:hypothetical protein
MLTIITLLFSQVPPSAALELIARTDDTQFVSMKLDEGRYVRFGTKDVGPVHVWIPPNYKPATAPLVVYVHGFFSNSDDAILQHQLIRQFRNSTKNAMYIVCEARSARGEPVLWADMDSLIALVKQKTKFQLPQKHVVAVGHSGAYRTILTWLKNEKLKQIFLVDGLYGDELTYAKWAQEEGHQLILVGFDTAELQQTLSTQKGAVTFDALPYLFDGISSATKKSKLVTYFSDRTEHMSLVTEGQLVPWLLKNFL